MKQYKAQKKQRKEAVKQEDAHKKNIEEDKEKENQRGMKRQVNKGKPIRNFAVRMIQ